MTILFYRYGSICEPGIINTFRNLHITVYEETAEMTEKNLTPSQCVEKVSGSLKKIRPVFVFSVNFFPAVAEVCHIYGILYLCQTVDSPVFELFSKAIQYDTNRIFLFDRAQYEYFHPYNPNCIFICRWRHGWSSLIQLHPIFPRTTGTGTAAIFRLWVLFTWKRILCVRSGDCRIMYPDLSTGS